MQNSLQNRECSKDKIVDNENVLKVNRFETSSLCMTFSLHEILEILKEFWGSWEFEFSDY